MYFFSGDAWWRKVTPASAVMSRNAGLAVPVAGDALSVFYRSNTKNYELLRKHAGTSRGLTWRGRLLIAAIVGGLLLVIAIMFLATIGLALQALRWIAGQ